MKYTYEETVLEVLLRSRRIRENREKKIQHGIAGLAVLLLGILTAVISVCSREGIYNAAGRSGSVYGAFLVPSTTGGYILVAVIAFIIGVLFAVGIVKYRNRNGQKGEDQQRSEGKAHE